MKTVQLKPNPLGKDRLRGGEATAAQLGAEWVDLKNEGAVAITLNGLSLYHVAYSGAADNGTWERVTGFTGSLAAGKVMRVHSGSGPTSALYSTDLEGADVHVFMNRDQYVWNNDRGDCSALRKDDETDAFDKAWYEHKPPEGVILRRIGDKLVVPSASLIAAGSRR